MRNKMKTEYDFTKGMLKTMRTLNESLTSKKSLKEEVEDNNSLGNENNKNDITVINDVEVKMMSSDVLDMKLIESQKTAISGLIDTFRQQVSQIVDFDPGMTMTPEQIRLDGTLTDEDVSFVLIAGREGGLYINADMLKIEQEIMDVLSKLAKFEETYKTAMEPLITQRTNN